MPRHSPDQPLIYVNQTLHSESSTPQSSGQSIMFQPPSQNSILKQSTNQPLVYRQTYADPSPFQQTKGEQRPDQSTVQRKLTETSSIDEYEGMSATEERKIVHFLRRLLSLPHVGQEDPNYAEKTDEQFAMLTQEIKKRLRPRDNHTQVPTRQDKKTNSPITQATAPQVVKNTNCNAQANHEQPKQTRQPTYIACPSSNDRSKTPVPSRQNSGTKKAGNRCSDQKLEPVPCPARSPSSGSTRAKSRASGRSQGRSANKLDHRTVPGTNKCSSSQRTGSDKTKYVRPCAKSITANMSSSSSVGVGGQERKDTRTVVNNVNAVPKTPLNAILVTMSPAYADDKLKNTMSTSSDTASSSPNQTSDDEKSVVHTTNAYAFKAKTPWKPGPKSSPPSPSLKSLPPPPSPKSLPPPDRHRQDSNGHKKYSFNDISDSSGIPDADARKDQRPFSAPVVVNLNASKAAIQPSPFSKAYSERPRYRPSADVSSEKIQPSGYKNVEGAPIERVDRPKDNRLSNPSRQSIKSNNSKLSLVTPVKVLKPQVGTTYSPHKYIVARPVTFTTPPERDVRFVDKAPRAAWYADEDRELTRLYKNDRLQERRSPPRVLQHTCVDDMATSAPSTGRLYEGHASDAPDLPAYPEGKRSFSPASSVLNVIPEENTVYLTDEETTLGVVDMSASSFVERKSNVTDIRASNPSWASIYDTGPSPSVMFLTSRIDHLQNQINKLESSIVKPPDERSIIQSDNENTPPESDDSEGSSQKRLTPRQGHPQSKGDDNNQTSLYSLLNRLTSESFVVGEPWSITDTDSCGVVYGIEHDSCSKVDGPTDRSSSQYVSPKTGAKRKLPSTHSDQETIEKKNPKQDTYVLPEPSDNRGKGYGFKREMLWSPISPSRVPPFYQDTCTQVNTLDQEVFPRRVKFDPPSLERPKVAKEQRDDTPSQDKGGRHDRQVYSLYRILTAGSTLKSCELLRHLNEASLRSTCKPPMIEVEDEWNGMEQKFDVRNFRRDNGLNSEQRKLLEYVIGLGKEEIKRFNSWSINVVNRKDDKRHEDLLEESDSESRNFYSELESMTAREQERIICELEKQRQELVDMKQMLSDCVTRMEVAKRRELEASSPDGVQVSSWQPRAATCEEFDVRITPLSPSRNHLRLCERLELQCLPDAQEARDGVNPHSYRSADERPMLPGQLRILSELPPRISKVPSLHVSSKQASDTDLRGVTEDNSLKQNGQFQGWWPAQWQKSDKKELPKFGEDYEEQLFTGSIRERFMSFFAPRDNSENQSSKLLDPDAVLFHGERGNTRSKIICYNSNVQSNVSFNKNESKASNNSKGSSQAKAKKSKARLETKRKKKKRYGCCAWFWNRKRHQSDSGGQDDGSDSRANAEKSNILDRDTLEKDISMEVLLERKKSSTSSKSASTKPMQPVPFPKSESVKTKGSKGRFNARGSEVSTKVQLEDRNNLEENRIGGLLGNRSSLTFSMKADSVHNQFDKEAKDPTSKDESENQAQDSQSRTSHHSAGGSRHSLPRDEKPTRRDSAVQTGGWKRFSLFRDNAANSSSRVSLHKRRNSNDSNEKPKRVPYFIRVKGNNHDGDDETRKCSRSRGSLWSNRSPRPAKKESNNSMTSDRGSPEKRKSFSQRFDDLIHKVSKPVLRDRSQSRKSLSKQSSNSSTGGDKNSERRRRPRIARSKDGGLQTRNSFSYLWGVLMNKDSRTDAKGRRLSKIRVTKVTRSRRGSAKASTSNHDGENAKSDPSQENTHSGAERIRSSLRDRCRRVRSRSRKRSDSPDDDPGELPRWVSFGAGSEEDASWSRVSQQQGGQTNKEYGRKKPILGKGSKTKARSQPKSSENQRGSRASVGSKKSSNAKGSSSRNSRPAARKSSSGRSRDSSQPSSDWGGSRRRRRERENERSRFCQLCRHYLCGWCGLN